jgi:hypothetical protein
MMSQAERPVDPIEQPDVGPMGNYDLAELLERAAGKLRQLPAPVCSDWVDAFVEGDAIGTDFAGYICNCSAQTIRRRATDAAAAGKPLGIWFAQSVWLISKRRLLDDIEREEGRPGRLVAETRAAQYAKMNAPLQKAPAPERAATG